MLIVSDTIKEEEVEEEVDDDDGEWPKGKLLSDIILMGQTIKVPIEV